jgi:hypothetical protein
VSGEMAFLSTCRTIVATKLVSSIESVKRAIYCGSCHCPIDLLVEVIDSV